MIKKLLISTLIILSIVNSNIYLGHCNEISLLDSNPIIYNYIYNDIDRIASEISLLSKTIFLGESNDIKKDNDKNLEQISFLTTQINSLLKNVQRQYDEYSNDKYILNGLYAISLILDEYRFSLIWLQEYISADTEDEKYESLQSFFTINSQAKAKLNSAKSIIPK